MVVFWGLNSKFPTSIPVRSIIEYPPGLNEANLIRIDVFLLHFAGQLYDEMIRCKTKDRGYYSAHFVKSQKKFVKGQQPIVKDLIRLVKYWRKTCIMKDTGKPRLPTSYPLELITIHCWEKAGKPERFDIRAGFKAVLKQLIENCHINVRWDEYYTEALARRGINGMKEKNKRFVFVLIKGKSQARPRGGGHAQIKATQVIVVPFWGSNL